MSEDQPFEVNDDQHEDQFEGIFNGLDKISQSLEDISFEEIFNGLEKISHSLDNINYELSDTGRPSICGHLLELHRAVDNGLTAIAKSIQNLANEHHMANYMRFKKDTGDLSRCYRVFDRYSRKLGDGEPVDLFWLDNEVVPENDCN